MGRPHRPIAEDAAYHVVGKGNNDQFVFEDDARRRRFLSILDGVVRAKGWRVFAYCVMGNHFHLALITPKANLDLGMRDLLGHYARWRNATYGRKGHAFGSRYHSTLIESDSHLLDVVRYVAMNPVMAGLASHATEWPWGSYRDVAAGRDSTIVDVDLVLSLFHPVPSRAREVLRGFLDNAPTNLPVEPTPLTAEHRMRRPSINSIFAVLPPLEATRACSNLGYTHLDIAAATGTARASITQRLRRDRRS